MIFCPRLMTVAHLKSDEMWEGLYKGFFNDPSYDLQEGEVSSSYGQSLFSVYRFIFQITYLLSFIKESYFFFLHYLIAIPLGSFSFIIKAAITTIWTWRLQNRNKKHVIQNIKTRLGKSCLTRANFL